VTDLPTGSRVVFFLILPAFAGLGIATVISWLPRPWDTMAMIALALVGMAWCARELRSTKAILRRLQSDITAADFEARYHADDEEGR
jgi:hypothetical protein